MKKEIRIKVYKKYDGHCAYCGKEIEYKNMQVDHKLPKALNRPIGRDIEGNYIYPDIDNSGNLMPSCRRCNHYKRATSLETYRWLMTTIHERLMKIYIFKVAVDYGIVQIKPFDGIFYFEKHDKIKPEGEEKKEYCKVCGGIGRLGRYACPTCNPKGKKKSRTLDNL